MARGITRSVAAICAVVLATPMLTAAAAAAAAAADDGTAPVIGQVSPHDGSNTVFLAQPLAARVTDAGGMPADGVRFELVDETAGRTTSHTARYDVSTGWARTEPVELSRDHVYRLRVTATDRAGNTATEEHGDTSDGGGFRAITAPQAAATDFTLSAEGKRTGEPGAAPGTSQWRFEPQLILGERTVRFTGAHHPGWGTLATELDLDRAKIRVTGAGNTAELALYSGQKRTVYQQVGYTSTTAQPRVMTVDAESFGLPAVTVDLPVGASAASVELSGATAGGSFGGVCADPSVGSAGCSTDPLRFFLDPATADRVDSYAKGDLLPNLNIGLLQMLPDVTAGADVTKVGGVWEPLKPDQFLDCGQSYGYLPNVAQCMVDQVLYPTPVSVVPPDKFAQFCGATMFCATLGPAEERAARKYSCIYPRWQAHFPEGRIWYEPWSGTSRGPGRDREPYRKMDGTDGGAGSKECQQGYILGGPWFYTTTGKSTNKRLHVFNMAWDSDWGVEDGGEDALGIHWTAPADKGMRWAPARREDVPQFGNKAVFASADTGLTDGLYPSGARRSAPETPDSDAAYVWRNCYNPTIPATMQWKDKNDDTGRAYGLGTGDNTSSRQGWHQYQTHKCSDRYAYMRMTGGRLGGVFQQVDKVGTKRTDGHFLSTYGHETKKLKIRWGFRADGPSCGISYKGKAGCDPFGITFVRTEEESKTRVSRRDHYGAFTYW